MAEALHLSRRQEMGTYGVLAEKIEKQLEKLESEGKLDQLTEVTSTGKLSTEIDFRPKKIQQVKQAEE